MEEIVILDPETISPKGDLKDTAEAKAEEKVEVIIAEIIEEKVDGTGEGR